MWCSSISNNDIGHTFWRVYVAAGKLTRGIFQTFDGEFPNFPLHGQQFKFCRIFHTNGKI